MLTVSFQPGLGKAQLGEQKHIVSRGNGCKSCRHMGSGEATSPQETATSPEAGRTGEEGGTQVQGLGLPTGNWSHKGREPGLETPLEAGGQVGGRVKYSSFPYSFHWINLVRGVWGVSFAFQRCRAEQRKE